MHIINHIICLSDLSNTSIYSQMSFVRTNKNFQNEIVNLTKLIVRFSSQFLYHLACQFSKCHQFWSDLWPWCPLVYWPLNLPSWWPCHWRIDFWCMALLYQSPKSPYPRTPLEVTRSFLLLCHHWIFLGEVNISHNFHIIHTEELPYNTVHCKIHDMTMISAEYKSDFELTKDIPYLTLTAQAKE